MKYTLLALLFVVNIPPCFAQKQGQAKVDSMVNMLPTTTQDTAQVRLLLNICFYYHVINPDEGIKYGSKALVLSEKMQWQAGIAHAYMNIGVNYGYKSDVVQAMSYYFKSLKIYEKLADRSGMGMCYTNLGGLYNSRGNTNEALEYYLKALKVDEELKYRLDEGINLGNIGEIYRAQKKYDKALEYYAKSSVIFEEFKDKWGIARTLLNSAIVYSAQGDLVRAIETTQQALLLGQELDNKVVISSCYGNLAEYYMLRAKDSLHTGSVQKKAYLQQAVHYVFQAIAIGKQSQNISYLQSHYETLTAIYQVSGDYKNALESYIQYTKLKDSITVLQNTDAVTRIENKRTIELKDKAIEITQLALDKKRNESIFYISGIILLLGATIFTFRERRISEQEREKSDKLLLNILPAEISHELKERGATTAKYFDTVTVLFTDFVDFTIAAETLDSEQLVGELHACFKAFDEIMGKYQIEKIKTIGDAYLAVCGLPIPNEKHAENVVNAAIDIREFMLKRRQSLGEKTFEIRIGIHSGSVVAGIVGVKKFAYDIWGDTVNTAARMEQSGEAGKINISETTYQLVNKQFACEYRGEIAAKNKGNLKMYFVERV